MLLFRWNSHIRMCVCVCDIVYAIRSTLLTTLTLHAVILVADVINTIRILLWFCRVHRYYAVTIMSLYTSNVFFFRSFIRPSSARVWMCMTSFLSSAILFDNNFTGFICLLYESIHRKWPWPLLFLLFWLLFFSFTHSLTDSVILFCYIWLPLLCVVQ